MLITSTTWARVKGKVSYAVREKFGNAAPKRKAPGDSEAATKPQTDAVE